MLLPLSRSRHGIHVSDLLYGECGPFASSISVISPLCLSCSSLPLKIVSEI